MCDIKRTKLFDWEFYADILFPIYGLLYIQIFYLRSHGGLWILRMWVRVQVTAPFFIIIITVRFQH